MNRISRYIIAAFGAVVTLVSCTKEPALVPEGSGLLPKGQLREIAVSFGESTKTVLGTTVDDTYHKYKPAFCPGDKIKVSNATRSEDCVVADVGGVLKIFTNLSGALKAVYPASAANVTGTNPIPETEQFKISATQTGKFSDANICTATIAADGTAASFVNRTALLRFYVDGSIGVQKITISGTADIATEGTDKKVITVDPTGTALISTVTEEPDKRLCYVAVLPGTNTLSIESVTTTQGTVSKAMKADFNYTQKGIFNAFLPYYIKIKVKDSPEVFQKWAYCNIGAFLPEEDGMYFAWGEVLGHRWSDGSWTNFPADNPDPSRYTSSWNGSTGGFQRRNCPFTINSEQRFKKYVKSGHSAHGTVDNRLVLEQDDDAAYVNWGENWCMPTREEVDTLISSTGSTKANFDEESGFQIQGTKLFFPISGRGDKTNIGSYDSPASRIWTSTLGTDSINGILYNFGGVRLEAFSNVREYGYPIRPIFHDPTDLNINPYVDDDIIK